MTKTCQVAILAGGLGTRLKEKSGDTPKPMVEVLGIPILEHQIKLCVKYGFTRIALLLHYQHQIIESYFGDGAKFGAFIVYVIERDPRGTAGALKDALIYLDDVFLVLYADTYADVNLSSFWSYHIKKSSSGTLFLHPNDHPQDSDIVKVDDQGFVSAIIPYPRHSTIQCRNLVNAALYILERDSLKSIIPDSGKFDLAKDIFPEMLRRKFSLTSYISPEYIKDMGTPDRLKRVEQDIISGLTERMSDRDLRPAVFIDRDGTINQEVNHLHRPEQIELISGVGEAIQSLNQAGYLAVGVTNQPVLARGDVDLIGLDTIHARLDQLLGEKRAFLDGLYVCPHHPDAGFAGEIAELKIKCDCRKPETGLIDRAVRELSVDRRKSWMIGDTTSDVLAGKRAGIKTILVRTGYAGLDGKQHVNADYVMPDLKSAVDFILRGHGAIVRQLFEICSEICESRLVLIGGCARSGKSTVASVIREMLAQAGRTVHIVSLDGWLLPAEKRIERKGVLARYDMVAMRNLLLPIIRSTSRHSIRVPLYGRMNRSFQQSMVHSVGPDDLLIVEGVTALLDKELMDEARIKIYVDVSEEIRHRRLKEDYAWRGENQVELDSRLRSRNIDEVPAILKSSAFADHCVRSE